MKIKKKVTMTLDPDIHREGTKILKADGKNLSAWVEQKLRALVKRQKQAPTK